jgi:hypothetical protein
MTIDCFVLRNGKSLSVLPFALRSICLTSLKKSLETAVSYLLLVVEPVEQRAARTQEQGREAYRQMSEYADGLKARGLLLACESLTSLADATRVSGSNGDTRVIDGPFAEAKEMVGGFFLLDTENHADAVAIAADCPAAAWCTIEVRKVGPCYF